MNCRRAIALLCALVAAGAIGSVAGCGRKDAAAAPDTTPAFIGVDLTGADYGRALSLTDQNGQARTLTDFKGKVVAVFFGYTHCPDACPTTLADLAQAKKALGADGDRLQTVFVTVDPARDTPELLKHYVTSFDPSFLALRGTTDQTAAAAKEFKVFYAQVPGAASGAYSVDHTAGTYLIDPAGQIRVFERYGAGAQPLAADIKALLHAG